MRLLLSQQGSLARLGHLRRRGSLFGLTATSDRLTTWLVKGYFYGDAAPTTNIYHIPRQLFISALRCQR